MALFRDGVDSFGCRWCSVFFHTLWDLVLVIVPVGKRYSYIRAVLSCREASAIINGRELFPTSNDTVVEEKIDDMGR